MNGIELSKAYYNAYGKKMIHDNFPELEEVIVVGLIGSGSECLGFDDTISENHDFEPRFMMFVPNNTSEKTIFNLEKAYLKLPKDFMGYKRADNHLMITENVLKFSDFFIQKVGNKTGDLSIYEWLDIPSFYLLEATNGEIFNDVNNEFTKTRDKLSKYPHDIKLKKIVGELILIYQSGIYNYDRTIKRNDLKTASITIYEFTKHVLSTLYLLNDIYMPYYKWWFKGLEKIPRLSNILNMIETLLLHKDNNKNIINEIIIEVINEISFHSIIKCNTIDLNSLAFQINNLIKDNTIRNLHILSGVKDN